MHSEGLGSFQAAGTLLGQPILFGGPNENTFLVKPALIFILQGFFKGPPTGLRFRIWDQLGVSESATSCLVVVVPAAWRGSCNRNSQKHRRPSQPELRKSTKEALDRRVPFQKPCCPRSPKPSAQNPEPLQPYVPISP